MKSSIRLCLVLHNHQPVGNFDDVFEQAYRDSYLPFLEVFEEYENLSISLHVSGPLAVWLDEHHGDYLDRIKALVLAGRVEIVGGGFYEPILTMLPGRDRVGQITSYTSWLQSRFDSKVQGAWVAERVWEASLAGDLADAEIRYTVLDDFHFRQAGLSDSQLHGYYVAEDSGKTIHVFPGSEKLRYLIPFSDPQETIDYLSDLARQHPGSVVVFGDDGEKFGTWPETRKHVYEDGWLRRFFDLIDANRDWLMTSTLADAIENTLPSGKVYLPDASYREMTEWVQPVSRQIEYAQLKREMQESEQGKKILSYARGGFWRNFKIRYPETNEMYSRMMYVSGMLEKAKRESGNDAKLEHARDHLYRGQCNCAYWHGAFGGLYLPHLRNAVYSELLKAENLIEQTRERPETWAEASADDYNFDGLPEIRLANEQLVAWISPAMGGCLYELDVREISHNLLATIDRAPEAYHEKVRQGENQNAEEAASIHDRVVFKQAGLDQKLQYDRHRRKTLIDHFWAPDTTLQQVAMGTAQELGDFANGAYQSKIRRGSDRVQLQLARPGNVSGHSLTITKAVTLVGGRDSLEIVYLLEGLPADSGIHFGVEFNFSGLPAGAEDRFFHFGDLQSVGELQTELATEPIDQIHLVDQWLGIDCGLRFEKPTSVWAHPIQSVSQSEGGFELVHQSVSIQPHWQVRGDSEGKWSVKMEVQLDTHMARSRKQNGSALAAT